MSLLYYLDMSAEYPLHDYSDNLVANAEYYKTKESFNY